MPKVTYIPQHKDDPSETTVDGHKFKANVARDVQKPGLVEMLKGNAWFSVEGVKRPPRELGVPGKPTDDRGYQSYALAWMQKVSDLEDFKKRWADEETLRTECYVGADVMEILQPVINTRLAELRG